MGDAVSKHIKEEILGKDWVAGKAGSGISQFMTHISNHAFVPGAVKQWDEDLQQRRDSIKGWKKRGLLRITKKMPDTMSGQSILDFCSIPPAVKLVNILKKKPSDLEARLQLVAVVLNQRRDLPVEAYRELYLQAAVVQLFDKYSMRGMQLALSTQDTYLRRFQAKCRHGLRISEKEVEEAPANEPMENKKVRDRKSMMIKKNINIIQSYLDHLQVVSDFIKCPIDKLSTGTNSFKGTYQLPTLKEIVLNENREKAQLFQIGVSIADFLKFHTLVSGITFRFPELMIRSEKEHALGYFLKGRIYLSRLVFALSRYEAGTKTESLKKEIQSLFKSTYHSYTEAVKKAGGHYAAGENDIKILIEYANVIRTFLYSIAKTINIIVPKAWAVDNIKRALQLLKQAESDHVAIQLLLKELGKDIEQYER